MILMPHMVPRNVPGSKQYLKSFGLDLVAMTEQRNSRLLSHLVTLTGHTSSLPLRKVGKVRLTTVPVEGRTP